MRPSGLALVVAALALGGCGLSEEPFPLRKGMHWLYLVEVQTMDGTFDQRYPVRTGAEREFGEETVYPHVSLLGSRTFYTRRDDGIWRVARQDAPTEPIVPLLEPALVLPAGVADARAWRGRTITRVLEHTGPPQETLFQIREVVPMRYQVAPEREAVTVPAGTFERCVKVVGHGTLNADVGNYIGRTTIEVKTTDWYAPGIGLVRAERTETTTAQAIDYGRMTMELAAVSR